MNREEKLALLKKRDDIKRFTITGDGSAFIEILEATVNELKDSVGGGIDLNADDLLDQLSKVGALKDNVDSLRKSIDDLKIPELPDSIQVDGLQSLVEATKILATRKQELPDPQPLIDIKKAIVDLTLKIEEQTVPDQGQQPSDYTPMRRVVLVGKKLMWDDSFYTGGGGGGSSIPTVNGTVPVSNAADNLTTGTIVANGDTVTTQVVSGMAGWTMGYYGTYATGASLTMEASHDGGSTYYSVRMLQQSSGILGYVTTIAAVVNSSSAFTAEIPAGATHLRVRCSAWAAPTGAINIVIGQAIERFASPVATQSIVSTALTPGTAATNLGKAEDAVAASGDTGVAMLATQQTTPADLAADGDYAWLQMKNGRLFTDATITGTVTVDDLAAAPTSAAVPANAQYSGSIAQTSLPTAATAGNLTGNMVDKFGRQVVIIDAIRDIVGMQTTTITASTAETTVATAVASTFLDVTSVMIANTSATATRVDFRDTTGGSVLFSIYCPAGDTRGIVVHTPMPQTTVNTNWTAQSSVSVTDLRIMMKYIKNK